MVVYRGDLGPKGVTGYEGFVRRSMSYAQVIGWGGSWARVEGPDTQLAPWKASGRTIMLSVSVLPGPRDRSGIGDGPVSLSACGSGAYDSHWVKLGKNLVRNGQAQAVIRPLREFNGRWYAWGITAGNRSDEWGFVNCFRHFVSRMRSVAGARFKFMWNPIVNVSQKDPSRNNEPFKAWRVWPGDSYVDYVGVNVYDSSWIPDTYPLPKDRPSTWAARRAKVWDYKLNGEQGLAFWRDFAKAHRKPLSLPEWGLWLWKDSDGGYHGGGDDPSFIKNMHDFIVNPATGVHDQAFWEAPGMGVSDPDWCTCRSHAAVRSVPQARYKFLELFKG